MASEMSELHVLPKESTAREELNASNFVSNCLSAALSGTSPKSGVKELLSVMDRSLLLPRHRDEPLEKALGSATTVVAWQHKSLYAVWRRMLLVALPTVIRELAVCRLRAAGVPPLPQGALGVLLRGAVGQRSANRADRVSDF